MFKLIAPFLLASFVTLADDKKVLIQKKPQPNDDLIMCNFNLTDYEHERYKNERILLDSLFKLMLNSDENKKKSKQNNIEYCYREVK